MYESMRCFSPHLGHTREQRSRPMNFDPDVVRREISMMYPYDPEYPWPGYSSEVMDGSLSWRMPDDLVVVE